MYLGPFFKCPSHGTLMYALYNLPSSTAEWLVHWTSIGQRIPEISRKKLSKKQSLLSHICSEKSRSSCCPRLGSASASASASAVGGWSEARSAKNRKVERNVEPVKKIQFKIIHKSNSRQKVLPCFPPSSFKVRSHLLLFWRLSLWHFVFFCNGSQVGEYRKWITSFSFNLGPISCGKRQAHRKTQPSVIYLNFNWNFSSCF